MREYWVNVYLCRYGQEFVPCNSLQGAIWNAELNDPAGKLLYRIHVKLKEGV